MCGCEKHRDESLPCSCTCDAHENFHLVKVLAMNRFHQIKNLETQVEELKMQIEAVLKP